MRKGLGEGGWVGLGVEDGRVGSMEISAQEGRVLWSRIRGRERWVGWIRQVHGGVGGAEIGRGMK